MPHCAHNACASSAGAAMAVAIGQDHIEIIGVKRAFFQKLLDHGGASCPNIGQTTPMLPSRKAVSFPCMAWGMLMGAASNCFATYRLLPVAVK